MTRAEFKKGMLLKMASMGLTEAEMEQAAARMLAVVRTRKNAFDPASILTPAIATAALAPPVIGGGLGLASGYIANDIDSDDVKEEKNRQLLETLKMLQARTKQNIAAKKFHQSQILRG